VGTVLCMGYDAANSFSGMFLWVRLIVQSLEECHSHQELIEAVETLPEGLDKA
jgi:hypothetical protein